MAHQRVTHLRGHMTYVPQVLSAMCIGTPTRLFNLWKLPPDNGDEDRPRQLAMRSRLGMAPLVYPVTTTNGTRSSLSLSATNPDAAPGAVQSPYFYPAC
jgi:hypothetical protein